jgi:CRISPR-associated protein Csd2
MGRKFTVPYGLYRCHGFISANLAARQVFQRKTLTVLGGGSKHVEHDGRSKGLMSTRALIVFKHAQLLETGLLMSFLHGSQQSGNHRSRKNF